MPHENLNVNSFNIPYDKYIMFENFTKEVIGKDRYTNGDHLKNFRKRPLSENSDNQKKSDVDEKNQRRSSKKVTFSELMDVRSSIKKKSKINFNAKRKSNPDVIVSKNTNVSNNKLISNIKNDQLVNGATKQSTNSEIVEFKGNFAAVYPINNLKNKTSPKIVIPENQTVDNSNTKSSKKKFNILSPHKELYDTAPIRIIKKKHKYPKIRKNFTVENTSKWLVRWTGGVQINKNDKPRGNNCIHISSFNSTYGSDVLTRKFIKPTDYITENDVETKSNIYAYQIDVEDELWIEQQNCRRNEKKLPIISPHIFQKIMNILETDLYLASTKIQLQQLSFSRCFFDDPDTVACDICYSPECEADDNIVFCEGCESVVHQTCYGLDAVPESAWLCDLCLLEKDNIKCLLCPLPNGTMKKTACSSGMVHVSCALWIPEVTFEDAVHREGIVINTKKRPPREIPICEVCNLCYGSYIECSIEGCKHCYHVTCGQRSGHFFYVVSSESNNSVEFISYCKEHSERDFCQASVSNEYTRSNPRVTKEEIESRFINYAESHTNPAFADNDKEILDDVFEYWKIKRIMKRGPLISPYAITIDCIPTFTDNSNRKNNINRRKEPRETRMAADKVRTLMWMTQDRENRKRTAMTNISELINNTINSMNKNKNEWTDAFIDSFFEEISNFFISKNEKLKANLPIKYIPSLFKTPQPNFEIKNYINESGHNPKRIDRL